MSSIRPETSRRPFRVRFSDKRDFRDWTREQFPDLLRYGFGALESYPEFEERIGEIHKGAMLVLNRLMGSYPDPAEPMHEYYARDFENLPAAFEKKDHREYALRLEEFLDGIYFE